MAPIGLNVPKLLPITGTWAAPFTLYYILLSGRIVAKRIQSEVFIGDDSSSKSTGPDRIGNDISLAVLTRCQANFIENVPFAFILATICELNGGKRKSLNYLLGALFVLRVAHADGGMMLNGKFGGGGVGRPIGFFGTIGTLAGLAGYAAWLVRGFWGFE